MRVQSKVKVRLEAKQENVELKYSYIYTTREFTLLLARMDDRVHFTPSVNATTRPWGNLKPVSSQLLSSYTVWVCVITKMSSVALLLYPGLGWHCPTTLAVFSSRLCIRPTWNLFFQKKTVSLTMFVRQNNILWFCQNLRQFRNSIFSKWPSSENIMGEINFLYKRWRTRFSRYLQTIVISIMKAAYVISTFGRWWHHRCVKYMGNPVLLIGP